MFLGRDLLDTTEFDTASFLPAIVAQKIPEPSDAVKTAIEDRTDLQSMKYLSESNKGGAKIFDVNP